MIPENDKTDGARLAVLVHRVHDAIARKLSPAEREAALELGRADRDWHGPAERDDD